MAARKKPARDGDAHLLAKYEHHRGMAEKHRAHADLIEAKLRTQGKKIAHEYGPEPSRGVKRKIVKSHE